MGESSRHRPNLLLDESRQQGRSSPKVLRRKKSGTSSRGTIKTSVGHFLSSPTGIDAQCLKRPKPQPDVRRGAIDRRCRRFTSASFAKCVKFIPFGHGRQVIVISRSESCAGYGPFRDKNVRRASPADSKPTMIRSYSRGGKRDRCC